jgi:hypothetical protein
MSLLNELAEKVTILAQSRSLFGDEGDELEMEQPGDLDKLIEHRNALAALEQAARIMRRQVDEWITVELGPNGAANYGDTIYRVVSQGRWVPRDPRTLAAWLLASDKPVEDMVAVYGPIRKTGVEAAAARRGDSIEAAVTTLLTKQGDEPKLSAIPKHRAPKFLQQLPEGGRL